MGGNVGDGFQEKIRHGLFLNQKYIILSPFHRMLFVFMGEGRKSEGWRL